MGAARAVAPDRPLRVLAAFGVLLYAGVGLASMLAGGNFLEYGVLAAEHLTGQHLGIFLIELGVGITVTAVMIIIFFAFAERGVRP